MQFENFYLVGGYRFPPELGKQAEADLNFKYLGKIAQDEQLDDFVLNGKSLIDLPNDNKAYLSVKEILKSLIIFNKLILHYFFETLHFYISNVTFA